MSFIAVPVTSGSPTQGYSTPTRCSFCVQDDGGGGQILVNMLGVTSALVSSAVDLGTLFGTSFRSIPLKRAFRSVTTLLAACDQFNTYLNINANFINGVGVAGALGFTYLQGVISSGPANAVYLGIAGPSIAGIWRVDLALRSSIVG